MTRGDRHSGNALGMEPARTEALRQLRCQILENPSRWALLLDIDGTLLDIACTPDGVVVPPSLIDNLGRISIGLGQALALVTGRSIQDADRLLCPLRLIAAGVHGSEMRTSPSGGIRRSVPELPMDLVAKAERVARSLPGVMVENKGTALTLHFRRSAESEAELETTVVRLLALERLPLRVQRGRKVIELVPAHVSKADAVEAILRLPLFARRRPIVIGDDAADEPSLLFAKRRGGVGLRVAGEHFPCAVAEFHHPREVRAWLGELSACLVNE